MKPGPIDISKAARLGGALAAVGAVTVVLARWLPVNPATAGFIYLITILLIATIWGFRESIAASFAAALAYNFFFIPPVGTLSISDPHDWVGLVAFLATALIASQLSERAKRRAEEAVRRQRELERLYEVSRAGLLTIPQQPFAAQIAREIRRIYEIAAVGIFDSSDGAVHAAGTLDMDSVKRNLEEVMTRGSLLHDPASQTSVTVIRLGGQAIGGLVLQGAAISDAALEALASLVAVGLERMRAEEISNRAEAARQSEEFKSTLLDALAHEFQTPLTSIKAAASAILSNDVADREQQRDLLTVVDQEASRLSALVTEAIHLARVEAGRILLERKPQSVRSLVASAMNQMAVPLEGRTADLFFPDDLPAVSVDADLVELALKQLIGNAAKYSPPDSPISIRGGRSGDAVWISLRNEGEAIPERERSKIFERFYRGERTRNNVVGSGLGLGIAREIIRAHGGDLRVESNPEAGTEFFAIFPLAAKGMGA